MRLLLSVILVASVAGCDEEDDDCDPGTYYLTFHSSDTKWIEYNDADTYVVGSHAIALGGVQRFEVGAETGCGDQTPVTPLEVRDDDPQTATETTVGATIDVRGVAAGDATLELLSDVADSRVKVAVAPIASVRLVGDELGEPGAFYQGATAAKIQLLDADGQWLVDRSLTVSGDFRQGARWNEVSLAGASAGDHLLSIAAGTGSWPVTATIVDHIDGITARDAVLSVPQYLSTEACFFATTDGRLVDGVPWQIDFDELSGTQTEPNCVEVWLGTDHRMQTAITAHALGYTATTVVTFTP